MNTMDSFWEYVLVGGAAFLLLLELLALVFLIREVILVFRETRY